MPALEDVILTLGIPLICGIPRCICKILSGWRFRRPRVKLRDHICIYTGSVMAVSLLIFIAIVGDIRNEIITIRHVSTRKLDNII